MPPPIVPKTMAIPGAEKEPTNLPATPAKPIQIPVKSSSKKEVIKISKTDWDKLGK